MNMFVFWRHGHFNFNEFESKLWPPTKMQSQTMQTENLSYEPNHWVTSTAQEVPLDDFGRMLGWPLAMAQLKLLLGQSEPPLLRLWPRGLMKSHGLLGFGHSHVLQFRPNPWPKLPMDDFSWQHATLAVWLQLCATTTTWALGLFARLWLGFS